MKKDLKLLWELQNLEGKLKKISQNETVEDLKELKKLKEDIERQKEVYKIKKKEFEKYQRKNSALESEIADLKDKLQNANNNLYDSENNSPKELEQAQKKADHIFEQISELEDRLLEKIDEDEKEEQALQEIKNAIKEEIMDFKKKYTTHIEKKELKEKELASIKEQIHKLKSQIDKETLEWFYQIRERFLDKNPVAKVVNKTCDGCNMVISFDLGKRLKSNSKQLICESCGRFLFPE